jgi:hypothetical protein
VDAAARFGKRYEITLDTLGIATRGASQKWS